MPGDDAFLNKHGFAPSNKIKHGAVVDLRSKNNPLEPASKYHKDNITLEESFVLNFPCNYFYNTLNGRILSATFLPATFFVGTYPLLTIFAFVAVLCCLGFHEFGEKRDNFSTKKTNIDMLNMLPSPNLSRFFKRDEFDAMKGLLGKNDTDSLWSRLHVLIAEFNTNNAGLYQPGWYMCIDESYCIHSIREIPKWISKLNGRVDNQMEFISPGNNKNPHKPQGGVGTEYYTSSFLLNNQPIILSMLPVSNALIDPDVEADFPGDDAKIIKVVLTLLKPYFMTWRIIFLDSRFASVKTAHALLEYGLYVVGVVKQNRKHYPINEMKSALHGKERGFTITYQHNVKVHVNDSEQKYQFQVYATGVKVKKSGKNSIFTFIHTACIGLGSKANKTVFRAASTSSNTNFVRKRIQFSVPYVFNMYSVHSKTVDKNNHRRQGNLPLENIRTKSFLFKNTTFLLGVCFANAIGLYKSQTLAEDIEKNTAWEHLLRWINATLYKYSQRDQREFRNTASPVQIVDNKRLKFVKAASQEEKLRAMFDANHVMLRKEDHPEFRKVTDGRSRCKVCKEKTKYYCQGCSTLRSSPNPSIFVHVCYHKKQEAKDDSDYSCYLNHVNFQDDREE